MPSKKEVLEKEPEAVVIVDETGEKLTQEEALAEEKRLDGLIEMYFLNNPEQRLANDAQEQEDEEDITVTVSKEGSVVKEEIIKTVPASGEVILSEAPNNSSFVEDEILRQVVSQHIKQLDESFEKIKENSKDFYVLSQGGTLFDNIVDAYRKEQRELTSLLFGETILLNTLENDKLKYTLEQETKLFIKQLFQFVGELAN